MEIWREKRATPSDSRCPRRKAQGVTAETTAEKVKEKVTAPIAIDEAEEDMPAKVD